jgi:hypothetical protein
MLRGGWQAVNVIILNANCAGYPNDYSTHRHNEGMEAIPGIKAMPLISFALVHNGGAQRRSGGRSHASLRSTPPVAFGLRRTDLHSFP